jgi:hypothetical protein
VCGAERHHPRRRLGAPPQVAKGAWSERAHDDRVPELREWVEEELAPGTAAADDDFNVGDDSDDGSDGEDDVPAAAAGAAAGAAASAAATGAAAVVAAEDDAEDDAVDAAAGVQPEFSAEEVAKANELVCFPRSCGPKTAIVQAFRNPSLLVQEVLVDKTVTAHASS